MYEEKMNLNETSTSESTVSENGAETADQIRNELEILLNEMSCMYAFSIL